MADSPHCRRKHVCESGRPGEDAVSKKTQHSWLAGPGALAGWRFPFSELPEEGVRERGRASKQTTLRGLHDDLGGLPGLAQRTSLCLSGSRGRRGTGLAGLPLCTHQARHTSPCPHVPVPASAGGGGRGAGGGGLCDSGQIPSRVSLRDLNRGMESWGWATPRNQTRREKHSEAVAGFKL